MSIVAVVIIFVIVVVIVFVIVVFVIIVIIVDVVIFKLVVGAGARTRTTSLTLSCLVAGRVNLLLILYPNSKLVGLFYFCYFTLAPSW